MSLGLRLREERLRLGVTQTALAAQAGASKGAQINWEKDVNSPPASALAAYAESGIDVLYVLTGYRTKDPNYAEAGDDLFRFLTDGQAVQRTIEERLAHVRRDLLDPQPIAGESERQAEDRVLAVHENTLRAILTFETSALTADLREEIEHLLDIISSPAGPSLYRAGNFTQRRARRREVKETLATWLEAGPYQPGEAVTNLLATLALDHAVPIKLLAELVQELHDDVIARMKPKN